MTDGAPPASDMRDKPDKGDDRLALMATLIGAGLAASGWRAPTQLVSGLALGLGGAVFALRGGRAISGRNWLRAAMVICALAFIASMAIALYLDWLAGQWIAEGARANGRGELRTIARLGLASRYAGLFCALSFLFTSLVQRFGAQNKKGPD